MCGHGDTIDVSTVERPCEDTGRRQHPQAKERGQEETKRANTSILIFLLWQPLQINRLAFNGDQTSDCSGSREVLTFVHKLLPSDLLHTC